MRGQSGTERTVAAAIDAAKAAASSDTIDALDAAIEACQQAITVISEDGSEHGMMVMQLASLIGRRWARTRDEGTWLQGRQVVELWLDRVPPPDWRAALYILADGILKYHRADETEEPADIAGAIAALEAARRRVKYGAGVYITASMYLADLRLRLYHRRAAPYDLEAAIYDATAVVGSQRAMVHERVMGTRTLASALLQRHAVLNDEEDIEAAIGAIEEALELEQTAQQRANLDLLLSSALRSRYAFHHQEADLDRVISLRRAHVSEDLDPLGTAIRLDDLGSALTDRYELRGTTVDLYEAVRASRDALAVCPPSAPERARMLCNLGLSLAKLASDQLELKGLDEAIAAFKSGLAAGDITRNMTARLQAGLASAHQLRDASTPSDEDLSAAVDALESAHAAAVSGEMGLPVHYRLAIRGEAEALADRLLGVLLKRAARTADSVATQDHFRAFAVGEGGKSGLLLQALLHRTIPPLAPGSGLGVTEGDWIARLAALDARETAPKPGTTPERRLHWMLARQATVRSLEGYWESLSEDPEHADYSALRRDPAGALLRSLGNRPSDVVLLSFANPVTVDRSGKTKRGLCAFAWWKGEANPTLLFNTDQDPIPDAVRRFLIEVPNDAGQEAIPETWWERLAELLPPRMLDESAVVIVSPTPEGASLPWALALERCGWHAQDQSKPLPVAVVPTLATVMLPSPSEAAMWHELTDSTQLDRDLALEPEDQEVAYSVRVSRPMATRPARPPIVVGNPTSDLPSAEGEAVAVAAMLGVDPLIGDAATVNAVRPNLGQSTLVHLAAHAEFDAESPLESRIHLADGDLHARDLIGTWSAARLVVLSACEAGSGAPVRGGELLGLSTGLLHAGVRGVVASLWPADDAATAYLMTEFHRHLRDDIDPVRALAAAQASVRTEPGWDSPYYWAGFVASTRGGTGRTEVMAAA